MVRNAPRPPHASRITRSALSPGIRSTRSELCPRARNISARPRDRTGSDRLTTPTEVIPAQILTTGIIVGALVWAARSASSEEDSKAFDEAAEQTRFQLEGATRGIGPVAYRFGPLDAVFPLLFSVVPRTGHLRRDRRSLERIRRTPGPGCAASGEQPGSDPGSLAKVGADPPSPLRGGPLRIGAHTAPAVGRREADPEAVPRSVGGTAQGRRSIVD